MYNNSITFDYDFDGIYYEQKLKFFFINYFY